ncbi:SH2 domain-containing protein 3C isoform X3 [Megalobrama amblycephala]|uniref:SH2 domain-containing protein 3C isoform X3 n=1 Tax=Megalobrama amblycephala TaxID=75352 RepID=UPI002013C88F|nr:SH2 domain-containing protein 3C isoform X3 [Megalobrama amblycephala]
MIKRKLSFKWFGSLTNLRRKSDAQKDDEAIKEMSADDMGMNPRSQNYASSSEMYTHMGTMPRHSKKDKSLKKSKSKDKNTLSQSQSMRPAQDHVVDSPLLSVLQGLEVLEHPIMEDKPTAGTKDSRIQNRDLPLPPTVDGHSTKLEDEHKEPVVVLKLHVDPTSAYLEPSPDLCLSKESKVQPVLPKKKHKEEDASLKVAEEDSNSIQLPLKMSSQMEQKTAVEEDANIESDCKQDSQEKMEPNRQLDTTDNKGEYVEQMAAIQTASRLQTSQSRVITPKFDCKAQEGEEVQRKDRTREKQERRGEDTKIEFSKEKYLLESPPEKLRKELEEELKLSSSDMRSHGWYHGHIPREASETLVLRSGDFLVRDSLSTVGDYVLTCRWQQEVIHCRISKVLVKSGQSKIQYMLEHESFDSVPTLVRHHAGTGRPVCPRTGAQLLCPVNRTLPLRYLEATFALAGGRPGSAHSPSAQRGAHIKRRSVTMTDGLTTEKIIPHSPSTVHHKDAMRNCAMSMDQIQEYRCPLSPVGEAPLSPAYSSISRHRHGSGGRVLAVIPPSPVMRRSSDPHLSPSSSNNNLPCSDTPLSTHSTPAHGYPSESSEQGGSYCELRPGQAPIPPCKSYVERLRVEEGQSPGSGAQDGVEGFMLPLVETSSSFKPGKYQSTLLPAENKPLEMSVLKRVKELLAEVDPKTAAKHITKADCMVARILGVTKEMQRMMGVSSGLELLTLPHGHQLRLDLLERFYTMSIMMAVDLLGCTGSTEERAALLHKTIQLAAELKSNMGNMYGFAAVMRALELPQISRLEQTWITLRQRHTEGAILYEKKLKPFLKAMNDGKETCVLSNTSFPHVVPVLSLLERGVAAGEALESWESVESGVDVVMSHLEAARTIAHHGGLYRTNTESKLQDFQERKEVLEIFCTEFQMRLLWGSRGSEGSQAERYEKFDKVLTALSHKLEPPVRHSEL